MPSNNATRFEIAMYVDPEYVDAVRALIETPDDRKSLTLHMEKLVGALLAGEPMADSNYGYAPYGMDIAEIYPEGES